MDFRSEKMLSMFKSGISMAEISRKYGVSRERVRQILNKDFGTTRKDGGTKIVTLEKLKNRQDVILKKRSDLYGCDEIEFLYFRGLNKSISMTPLRSFLKQKTNAKYRGIGWNITITEWWEIWQKSGLYDKRGLGRGKYCMCRYGDVGQYEKGNVFIGESIDNLTKFPMYRRKALASNKPIDRRETINEFMASVYSDSIES